MKLELGAMVYTTENQNEIDRLLGLGAVVVEGKENINNEIPNYKSFKKVELEELLDELNIKYESNSTNDDKIALLDEHYIK